MGARFCFLVVELTCMCTYLAAADRPTNRVVDCVMVPDDYSLDLSLQSMQCDKHHRPRDSTLLLSLLISNTLCCVDVSVSEVI